jgi:VHL beta domain
MTTTYFRIAVFAAVCVASPLYGATDPAAHLSCSAASTTKSLGGGAHVSVSFANTTNGVVSLYWINYQGQATSAAVIQPGTTYCSNCGQNTYVNHFFLAKDAAGNCLGLYQITGSGTLTISSAPSVITGNDRATADSLWNNYYLPALTPPNPGWASKSQCDPGTISAQYQTVALQRINYYRRMMGLLDAEIDSTLLPAAQAAAFLVYTNNSLNHNPPTTWTCYSTTAVDGTSHSNMGVNMTLSGTMDGFIMEDLTNNPSLGHRRYLIEPAMWKTATGHVPGETFSKSNWTTVYVISATMRSASAATMKYGFSGWPSPGYVPAQLVPKDWQFVLPGKDFNVSKATVTVNGAAVSNSVAPLWSNTIIFTPAAPAAGSDYNVSISIPVAGSQPMQYSYKVTPYSITPPPPDFTVWPLINAASFPFRGQFDNNPPTSGVTYSLVPGAGDTDNAKFVMESTGMSFKGVANQTAAAPTGAYSIRVRATNAGGTLDKVIKFP